MTQFSDGVRVGAAYWPTALSPSTAGSREDTGVQLPALQVVALSAPAAAATNNIVNAFTATANSIAITLGGALVSGGVATLDYARCVQFSATSDLSFGTIRVTGTDTYGQTLVANIAGPNANTVTTLSAFKTVTAAAWTATNVMASALSGGASNTFGLPYVLTNTGRGLGQYIDGSQPLSSSTWTAGLGSVTTPTATTADVRGTVAMATSALPNAARNISLLMQVDPSVSTGGTAPNNSAAKVALYGQTPYAG